MLKIGLKAIFIGLFVMTVLHLKAQDKPKKAFDEDGMKSPEAGLRYSLPIVQVGGGSTFYTGNLKSPRNLSKFSGVRWGLHAGVEQRLGNYFGIGGRFFYGFFAGEKHTRTEFMNFQSRQLSGDVMASFHFDQIMGSFEAVAPYISAGVGYANLRTRTDARDADDKFYYLWDDGILRDQSQSGLTNGNPQQLYRDFTYETVLASSIHAIRFPVEAGVRFKLHDFWDLGLSYQHAFYLSRFHPDAGKGIDHGGYLFASLHWYTGVFNKGSYQLSKKRK
jgi:opacity protein-like surface antigen